MALPPTVVVDRSVRVPCSCGKTTVWPYIAGGRGLTALPHPSDGYALVQHVDDGPCGRVRRYPPTDEPRSARPVPVPAFDEPEPLFDLDTLETR